MYSTKLIKQNVKACRRPVNGGTSRLCAFGQPVRLTPESGGWPGYVGIAVAGGSGCFPQIGADTVQRALQAGAADGCLHYILNEAARGTERLRIRLDFARRAALATGMDTGRGQVVANARCSMNGWRDRATTSAVTP